MASEVRLRPIVNMLAKIRTLYRGIATGFIAQRNYFIQDPR